MQALKKFLKDLFTENDNESADLMPIVAMLAVLTYLGLYVYLCAIKGTLVFNGTEFGTGFGIIQAAWALSYKLKLDAQTKAEAEAKP